MVKPFKNAAEIKKNESSEKIKKKKKKIDEVY